MKFRFLKSQNNPNLLILFGGWSTLPEDYATIEIPESWDLLAVTSYSDFNFPLEKISHYRNIGLIAWSLGVFAAMKSLAHIPLAFAVAINGTPQPVSDKFGIPETIYRGTSLNLNPGNLARFRKRMGVKATSDLIHPDDDIETLVRELNFIAESSANPLNNFNPFFFSRAYISTKDKIFSPDNQLNAWKNFNPNIDIIQIEGDHFPDFNRLINSLIFPRENIGKSFLKALPFYDNKAEAQNQISQKLISLVPSAPIEAVLEIGPGTGSFSKLISQKLSPLRFDMVELFQNEYPGFTDKMNLFVDDAESWMEKNRSARAESYDAILSANVMQWFYNPKRFLENCYEMLKPGGFILLSTFSPKNLYELRYQNPFPLIYRSVEELKSFLNPLFKDLLILEEKIPVRFSSQREMLRHISQTGVGATGYSKSKIKTTITPKSTLYPTPDKHTLKEISSYNSFTLTFAPIYILGYKKG